MKSSRLPALRRTLLLFVFGGACYNLIEILWRGYTHWSMFFLGGVCFQWGGLIARRFRRHCLAVRCVLCSAAVTVSEFLCACGFICMYGTTATSPSICSGRSACCIPSCGACSASPPCRCIPRCSAP